MTDPRISLRRRNEEIAVATALHNLGLNLTLCRPELPRAVIPENLTYLKERASLQAVLAHARNGKPFGVIPHWEDFEAIVVDVDQGDPTEFMRKHPPLFWINSLTPGHAHLWYPDTQRRNKRDGLQVYGCTMDIISNGQHVALPDIVDFYKRMVQGMAAAYGISVKGLADQLAHDARRTIPLVLVHELLRDYRYPAHLFPTPPEPFPSAAIPANRVDALPLENEYPSGGHLPFHRREQGLFDLSRKWVYRQPVGGHWESWYDTVRRCVTAVHSSIPYSQEAVNAGASEDRTGYLPEYTINNTAKSIASYWWKMVVEGVSTKAANWTMKHTIYATAERTGENPSDVASRFAEYSKVARRKRKRHLDIEVTKYHEAGNNVTDTARRFNVKRGYIYRACQRIAEAPPVQLPLMQLSLAGTVPERQPAPGIFRTQESNTPPPNVRALGFPQTPFHGRTDVRINQFPQNTSPETTPTLSPPDLFNDIEDREGHDTGGDGENRGGNRGPP